MDVEQLKAIVEALSETDITRFDYRNETERLIIRRGPEGLQAMVHPLAHLSHGSPMQMQMQPMQMQPMQMQPMQMQQFHAQPQGAPAGAAAAVVPPKVEEIKGVVIASPFVGTFYRSPSPEAPTFVEIGQVVKKGQTLCIVEAMKLMNEIEADVSGKVAEIYAQSGQSVEFGEKLFRIEPA